MDLSVFKDYVDLLQSANTGTSMLNVSGLATEAGAAGEANGDNMD